MRTLSLMTRIMKKEDAEARNKYDRFLQAALQNEIITPTTNEHTR